MIITASIVLYNTDSIDLLKAIDSILKTTLNIKLYLIDNSPGDNLKIFQEHDSRILWCYACLASCCGSDFPAFGHTATCATGSACAGCDKRR